MKYSMVFSAVLMSLALSACDKPTVVNPAPVATVSVPGPADPSIPAATPATSAASPTSLQSKANPQGVMTKQEESLGMPRPGQAGDHSSAAFQSPK